MVLNPEKVINQRDPVKKKMCFIPPMSEEAHDCVAKNKHLFIKSMCFTFSLEHTSRYSGWWLTYPSEKYESQLGLVFPIYGKS